MRSQKLASWFLILILLIQYSALCSEQIQSENKFYSFLQVDSKSGTPHENSINGKIKINGMLYNTVCDCTGNASAGGSDAERTDQAALAQCDPSKMKLHQDRTGDGASFDEVRNLIGHPSELSYVNVAEHHFECLDGRIRKGVLGTPGGDAGEFILALFVYENMENMGGGQKLTQEKVTNLLQKYLKSMKQDKFYMCTDDTAIEHLERESGMAINIEMLRNPPEANRKDLMDYLYNPDNNGCTHIKSLLKNPQFYAIREEIVRMFLTAFYQILWDRKNELREKLMLDNLIGSHNEKAFLEIRSNEACFSAQIAPLIRPMENKKDGLSIFVNHLEAASIRRAQLAQFFSGEVNHLGQAIDPKLMHHRMNRLGLAFLEATGVFIAKKLPFYTLNLV